MAEFIWTKEVIMKKFTAVLFAALVVVAGGAAVTAPAQAGGIHLHDGGSTVSGGIHLD